MRLTELNHKLHELRGQSLLREPDDQLLRTQLEQQFGKRFLDAVSNDYLGLAAGPVPDSVSRETLPVGAGTETSLLSSEPNLRQTSPTKSVSRETLPVGAGASRLVFGTHEQHLLLEQEIAAWLGREAALFFSSGYAANLGALGALLSKDDAVFSDALNHASLIDGIRLSGAQTQVFSHLNLVELEEKLKLSPHSRARWVVVESYYGMDGDGPDLEALKDLCERYDAQLYVDESHSIGTFGPQGRGLCAEQGVVPDVLMLAFGKAFGAQGACIVGSHALRAWLWNRARSFVFSTAPSPVLAALVRGQLRRVQEAENSRSCLFDLAAAFRSQLISAGIPLIEHSLGPIVSLVLGSAERALRCSELLRQQGVLAQAIRPPTVPVGGSRLRLVLRSSLSRAEVQRLGELVVSTLTSSQL